MPTRLLPTPSGIGSLLRVCLSLGFLVAMSGCDACTGTSPSAGGEPDASRLDAPPDSDAGTCGGRTCSPDEVCHRDRCTASCEDDAECLPGERCTQDGFCFPERSSAEGSPCLEDEHCDSLICEEDGHCVPPRACDHDGECFSGEVCSAAGYCIPACADPAECPSGDFDDADAGLDGSEHEDASDRIPECYTNDDCDIETDRCEDGMCIPLEICDDDLECPDGTYCHRGQCRPFCADNSDCRGEQICVDQRCLDVEDDAACFSTEDCEPCESCIYGVCTVSEYFCRVDDDCGYDKLCRNGFCTYECDAAEDCPRGQSCVDGVCLDDPPGVPECVFNDDCETDFICINGRCNIDCETHSECGFREMCDHGVCQPDRRPGAECLLREHCTDQDPHAQCVDGHCALPCSEDAQCVTLSCEYGFCTR